jgi:hypothetical protein
VRTAQRLLEDAQLDAQHMANSMRSSSSSSSRRPAAAGGAATAAAGAFGARGATGRLTAAAAGGRRSTAGGGGALSLAAAAGAVHSIDELRHGPLGTVLAQFREAQAAWAQEKVSALWGSIVQCPGRVPCDSTRAPARLATTPMMLPLRRPRCAATR